MNSEMEIVVSQEQGRVPVTVLHIKGEVGSQNYEQLIDQASEAIEAGAQNLVLDLAGITFMTSAGLRAMHAIYSMLQGQQESATPSQRLKLSGPPPNILNLIKAIGFDIYLEIYDNLEEAIASF